MPVVSQIFVITDNAHRTAVSEQSARDSALVALLKSEAACSGCRACYLKGKRSPDAGMWFALLAGLVMTVAVLTKNVSESLPWWITIFPGDRRSEGCI